MFDVFWVQLRALIWKNWIVISKRPFVNILRSLILPVQIGVFLAFAPNFFTQLNNYGMGTITPVKPLLTQFDGSMSLIWTDTTNSTTFPTPKDIISHVMSSFTPSQLAAVKQVQGISELLSACPQNYNGVTPCFAAIEFVNAPSANTSDSVSGPMEYIIHAEAGLSRIDVVDHTSDFENRILPLQWAIDSAVIELQTGMKQQIPLEWPFTKQTNEEQRTDLRLGYLRVIRDFVGLGFFMIFLGISYHMPGSFATEQALLITEHMKAMGLLDSARIISWHISISLTHLPAWIIVSVIWRVRVFTETNAALFIFLHILFGLSLASYAIVVAVPFGNSPHLAAVVCTLLSMVFAIMGLVLKSASTAVMVVISIICPPSLYMFSLTALTGYENHGLATDVLKGDPDNGVVLLALLITAIVNIFLWPIIAVLLESVIYTTRNPSKSRFHDVEQTDAVISIQGLTKIYRSSRLFKTKEVTAISDLSLDIPKTGIFVLLGSNGAGKSTLLSIIAGISSLTSGTITFAGGVERPPRGVLGIVPQKDVLFPELSCLQTLRVWRAVKWSKENRSEVQEQDFVSLLKDCDLKGKEDQCADTLSGGQKRKLQLAIGLLGGSKIVLVDECTSGVDPLSRRALWKTLTGYRDDRCIVFTTHFLDEADLLADQIGILASPGKLVANGSPVTLKRELGEGYCIQVNSPLGADHPCSEDTLTRLNMILPSAYLTSPSPKQLCYHLKTRDAGSMQQALEFFDCEIRDKKVDSYDILGTTIEEIFLDLMRKHDRPSTEGEKIETKAMWSSAHPTRISDLQNGRTVPSIKQASTIFYKRLLVFRRSWRALFLATVIAVCGSCIPLVFLRDIDAKTCVATYETATATPLDLQSTSILLPSSTSVFGSPPGIIQSLGSSDNALRVTDLPDNATFVDAINRNYRNLTLGGIFINSTTGSSLIAWEASPPGFTGASMLNLATNVLYNRALNMTGSVVGPKSIRASHSAFPFISSARFAYLRWMVFFGLVMAVYPAFFTLYVSKERRSSVQAMQFSNGLNNPVGLWLGHLMFDAIPVILISTVITIVFAVVANQKFVGLGYLWFILVQYGITAALLAYCVSVVASSPLFAFAMVAVPQFIFFLVYLTSYMFVVTYAPVASTTQISTIVHFTTSFISPVASVIRTALLSSNLFSILCNGTERLDKLFLASITKFGGPILYLFIQMFIYFAILIWADSGSRRWRETTNSNGNTSSKEDVAAAAAQAVATSDDVLRVLNISKSYNGRRVLDDVSVGVSKDTVFALLGPNGAGKTTTFNIIRGDVPPDGGEVTINGASVITNPRTARSHLGVCPQFVAIESELTVREHLIIYGRLKGLRPGPELNNSVDTILHGTSLAGYSDRLASKLSGGNQKKLSLAIALMGNPSVLLIDEFSTGVDPKMKREMWHTLKGAAKGKAVVVTTHSMEEASALANGVGILAKQMLAVGTVESLSSRYPAYEVHFSCRTREEVVKARQLMTLIPGSRMADDVATRFEVPIVPGNEFLLSKLFNTLAGHGDFAEYTVEKATLESVFIKVIRENNVKEQDNERHGGRSMLWCR